MSILKPKRMTSKDWRDIQNAVSNSDLPNTRRMTLLDAIDTQLNRAENREAAEKAARK